MMRAFITLTTVALLTVTTRPQAAPPTRTYDLVVYGATASGIPTAVAASREGLHVVLVDPSHHIGGLVTGGLSLTDTGNTAVIGGFSYEFFARVGARFSLSRLIPLWFPLSFFLYL